MSVFKGLARIARNAAFAGAVGLGLVAAAEAAPEKRVALVMGIGSYKQVPMLPNPVMDGRSIAESLKRLGFEVVEGYDLDRAGMDRALSEFTVKLEGAQTALFFYAGHGIAVGGENYFIPTDAKLENERLVELQTLPLGKVLKQMQIDAKTSIVILDACRDNPFAKELASRSTRTRSALQPTGLASIEVKQGTGTLLAFATDPGAVALDGKAGDNSPFATALLAHMETPGITISQVFDRVRGDVYRTTNEKQRPWVNTSIIGEYFLKPAAIVGGQVASLNQGVVPTLAPPASAAENAQFELRLWEEAKLDNSADSYRAYLARYPQGQFAQMAKLRIAKLEAQAQQQAAAPVAPVAKLGTVQTETALRLTREEVAELQLRLRLIGFEPGTTGGKWTAGARKALGSWQASRQVPTTGFLTAEQRVALMEDSQVVYDRHISTRTVTPAAPVAAPRPVAARPVVAPTRNVPVHVQREAPRPRVVHVPAQPRPQAPPRHHGGDNGAGAAIMGGIIGGVIAGGLMRRFR